MPSVSVKQAADAIKRWATLNLPQERRDVLNSYIHFGEQEEEVKKTELIEGMFILHRLDDQSETSRKRKRTEEESEEGNDAEDLVDMKKKKCFKRLLKMHPVNPEQHLPSLDTCKQFSEHYAQFCQDKWRRKQYRIRIEDVIKHFRKFPNKNQVLAYVKQKGWTTNIPKTSDVLEAWRLHQTQRNEENLQNFEVEFQEWTGLAMVEDETKGGSSKKSAPKGNHTRLVCKFCVKLQDKLSVHLRRVCLKTASEAEIRQFSIEAKKNLRRINASFSIVSYEELDFQKSGFSDPQMFFTDFLQRRGCFIVDRPAERGSDEEDGSESEDSEAARSGSPVSLRKTLAEAGVYRKHDLECPLLKSFKQYLKLHYTHPTVKQVMNNVARYLSFVNPHEITLEFINHPEKTKAFIQTFFDSKTSEQTVKNYVIHIGRFVKFLLSEQFPDPIEETTRQDAKIFLARIKKMTEETNPKRKKKRRVLLSAKGCRKVLTVAKPHVLKIFKQADSGVQLDDGEKILAVHYLVALLMLKHLRKPSVVHNLTVKAWLQRKNCNQFEDTTVTIITMPKSIIVLPQEEERLFSIYFRCIRHTMLDKTSKEVLQFFVSTKGKPIKNSCNDLHRFHDKLKLPLVSVKQAADAIKRWARLNLPQERRDILNSYIHFGKQEEEVKKTELIEAMFILHRVDDQSKTSRKRKRTEEESEEGSDAEDLVDMKKKKCFKRLLKMHPVNPEQHVPSLDTCKQFSERYAQFCQDKWRHVQYRIRIEDVIKHRKFPDKKQVSAYVKQKGWTTNIPRTSDVLEAWRPQQTQQKEENLQNFESKVESQEWTGLVMVEDETKGGYSVKTTQAFKEGDVVCDYHGVLMDVEKTPEDDEGCLFFSVKGEQMCLNASKAPCACHPHMPSTFGRLVNHSCEKDNVKAVLRFVQDGKVPVIVFEAMKDLTPGTELFFNYRIESNS